MIAIPPINRVRTAFALLLLVLSVISPAAVEARRPDDFQARNKALVLECLDLIFNQKDFATARTRCFGATYIQHNPRAPDGPDAILALMGKFLADTPQYAIEVKRAAADGDLVWVHYRATPAPGAPARAVVDIFRVANGKLVEHWDVTQPVPETSANTNTMF